MSAKKPTRSPPPAAAGSGPRMDFSTLVAAIGQVHAQSAAAVSRTINTTLTLRNWVIGWYIREYEQRGADRATYGEGMVNRLAGAEHTRAGVQLVRQTEDAIAVIQMIERTAKGGVTERLERRAVLIERQHLLPFLAD